MAFSTIAVEVMRERTKGYNKRVGSELKKVEPVKYKDYESTDCIAFVLNVLKETYMRQKND